jgi:hypothetical protein
MVGSQAFASPGIVHKKNVINKTKKKNWKTGEIFQILELDATDDFYCRSYCLPNMFRAPLCP